MLIPGLANPLILSSVTFSRRLRLTNMRCLQTQFSFCSSKLWTFFSGLLLFTGFTSPVKAEIPLTGQTPVLVSFIKELNHDYFPLGKKILGADATKTILEYGSGDNNLARMRSYSTIIHEGYHGWEGENKSKWKATLYLIEEGLELEVDHRTLFDTRKMHSEIPAKVKETVFRYDPYIYGDIEIGSHVHGIYGLMEEWNAYLLGSKASLALEPWFEERRGNKVEKELYDWYGIGYLMLPASSILANHEFRLFIAWYLDFAKRNHPDVYKVCMSHMQLRVAYTLIENEFQALEDEWFAKIEDFCSASEEWEKGRVVVERGYFSYKDESGGGGQGIFTEERDFLLATLSEPRFANVLADFRLSWVDKSNWQEAF